MSKELIRPDARQLFAELACNIYHYDIQPKLRRLCTAPQERIKESLEHIYSSINWSKRESVLAIVPLLEEIYTNAPRDFQNRHQKIDSFLSQDGFHFREGKLARIKHSLNECR